MPAPSSAGWNAWIKSDWSDIAPVVLSLQAQDLVTRNRPFRGEIIHFVHLQDDTLVVSWNRFHK
jgi:hypothetical protein